MATEAERKDIQLEEFVTFDDILALALARCHTELFTSDAGKWHEALFEVCEKYRDELPALREVFFREHPSPLQTNQFYELISILSASTLITLPNPNYSSIQMDRHQKKRAKALESKLLERSEQQIKGISDILERRLALGK